ncbi:hypothetical protein [Legionella impletisoli]|uniref:Uncharacterized protein n=1 Tax=Legionella impletisoli TaxID=343510 RepID=A0A917JS94_9GAMM|nr:hypothetical protein [Legionella impletisoli]GGI81939.1 hypothetical protein GCM10007966_08110 [Legionella impletisoli]
MLSFEPLNQLLEMDLTQLRANNGCATDESMEFFVHCINQFFAQIETITPTEEDKTAFDEIMKVLIERINLVEVDYFRGKFTREHSDSQSPEVIECMAQQTKLKDYHKLPSTMQYWARRGDWGDAIHNPTAHSLAVKRIEAWPKPVYTHNISAREAAGMFRAFNEAHQPDEHHASILSLSRGLFD